MSMRERRIEGDRKRNAKGREGNGEREAKGRGEVAVGGWAVGGGQESRSDVSP
ncbi:hypothetical protein K0M31_014264 [Melipona bicolor]|uniref:Uncharacterized protein n=1 Tax=Melipona bicolor TaxID=60889 RepID=A0AA40G8F3_9HYME|nr:hypothetical protein K0M31_014264 [Melipona bicolor]